MPSPETPAPRRMLWVIFLVALAFRWIYSTVLFASFGVNGITGVDSVKYLAVAQEFAGAVHAGTVHGWQWLGPDPAMMPLFTWILSINAFAGTLLPFSYVLIQGLFDAGTCVLVFLLAHAVHPRMAAPAAAAAAINPTQIVLSGLVYPDTPFVFFVTLMLFASIRWLRAPAFRWAALAGIALGAGALVRILIIPWTAALIVFLLITQLVNRRLAISHLFHLAAIGTIACLLVAPILARNVSSYGTWALTSQSGYHLAGWIVPLVTEMRDRTPWQRTFDGIEARKRDRFGPPDQNPFEESRRYTAIGRDEFSRFEFATLFKAWMFGAAINLASPGIILSPPVLTLPRTGFYATPGNSAFEKLKNFLFHSESALYTWVLLFGIAGVAALRLVQAGGILDMTITGGNWAVLLLFIAWTGFILAINGPVASPKYRLPIEPVLAVLTGAGINSLRRRRHLRRSASMTDQTSADVVGSRRAG